MSSPQIKALLVEDSFDDADILMETLGENVGTEFAFTHVLYLREAVEKFSTERFDVILVDLNLPDSEGISTFRKLHKVATNTPMVVLTGVADEQLAVEAVQLGAQDYLTKGTVDGPRILRALRFAIERHRNLVEATTGKQVVDPVEQTWNMGGVPKTIAGYHVRRTLGEGNTGIVFLVEKENEDGQIIGRALKILRPAIVPEKDPDGLARRFLQEAEIIAGVDHPNIVRVFDFGRAKTADFPYMLMEHIDGRSLRHFVGDKASLTYAEKASIVRQLADALSAVHAQHVYHRDIKPDNILVTRELIPKITDFGIARRPLSELTGPLEILGTPAYMAPESFVSSATDHRADIFSLGTLFYELLVGNRPFEADNIPQLARKITDELPVEPRKIVPDLPPLLQQVLARMLKKRPETRYVSAQDVVKDLDAFLLGASSSAADNLGNRLLAHVFGRNWS
ncbi:MAG: protein kinase [Lentisphaerae bacterium]|jgi:serine/threonine protein kinase|nr:protein kinase [Lentisphaerota bacterium]MBT4820174.1 protein kinase [Lentisphaerota bacterium]MBT5610148.1 protein kinase [Lentisphaerota bacterium]MBT7056952.1 protein kinase [Lentisphaerota bacterium]MBT7848296.1 protein kinase [Lentisphaerota bacterium]